MGPKYGIIENIFRLKMSWQQYVDDQLLATKQVGFFKTSTIINTTTTIIIIMVTITIITNRSKHSSITFVHFPRLPHTLLLITIMAMMIMRSFC